MPLKRLSDYKRDDYTYESPDGCRYDIIIVQTDNRQWVEIKQMDPDAEPDNEEGVLSSVSWDVDMLLDIADEVRKATQKQVQSANKPHSLKKPNVVDSRNSASMPSPPDSIQATVEESMGNIDSTVSPVESFSPHAMKSDIEERMTGAKQTPDDAKVKRAGVNAGDLL